MCVLRVILAVHTAAKELIEAPAWQKNEPNWALDTSIIDLSWGLEAPKMEAARVQDSLIFLATARL